MLSRSLLAALAQTFEAGGTDRAEIVARAAETLGTAYPWLEALADRFVTRFEVDTRPRFREVVRFLREDFALREAAQKLAGKLVVPRRLPPPQQMRSAPAACSWPIPAITSAGALADWLMLAPAELEWFADLKNLAAKAGSEKLSHYRYRILPKHSGGVRVIEAPKAKLKMIQQRILATILQRVPVHSAVHGFVRGRSIQTFAAPHANRRVVLRMDLQNFFASVAGVRVQAFFRTGGYPETVADLLGGLCTNTVPGRVLHDAPFELRMLYRRPHLPQGAPTSPALANICAYRADCRLSGLAAAAGAEYTRYADDLAFSGEQDFERAAERFAAQAAAILTEEGFAVHHRKTRFMRSGVRQHLAGLVLNEKVNVLRADFDRLKAVLTNCVRYGPASQNRDNRPHFRAHLEGQIAFVAQINAAKGERLRAIFERIDFG